MVPLQGNSKELETSDGVVSLDILYASHFSVEFGNVSSLDGSAIYIEQNLILRLVLAPLPVGVR